MLRCETKAISSSKIYLVKDIFKLQSIKYYHKLRVIDCNRGIDERLNKLKRNICKDVLECGSSLANAIALARLAASPV